MDLGGPYLSSENYDPPSPNMGLSGLEPPTSRLSGVRSNQLSYKPLAFYSVTGNGDGEIRTLDPLLARQVLSQLSYTPTGYGLRWALPLFREL